MGAVSPEEDPRFGSLASATGCMSSALSPEVIRDWEDRRDALGEMRDEDLPGLLASLKAFSGEGVDDMKAQYGQASQEQKSEYVSNKVNVEALGRSLSSVGLQLQMFCYAQVLKPLCQDERRYGAPQESWPSSFALVDRGRKASIENLKTRSAAWRALWTAGPSPDCS